MDRDRLRGAIRGTASPAGCHSRDSLRDAIQETTVFRPLHTSAIDHALLDCIDGCARPTRFATSLTLCPARRIAKSFT